MKKILIVDDDPHFITLFSKRLMAHNYEVVSAILGREGIDKVRAEHPDLIILDLKMPEIDGFAVANILRQTPATRDIPIIILTGYCSPEDVAIARKIGIADYVEKCADLSGVIKKIDDFFVYSDSCAALKI